MKLHYLVAWAILRAAAMLLWGFRARGGDRIPESGPVVIACNHISNWDPILVALACRREVHFLAKAELFKNPAFAWLIRAYNALPVRRGVLDRRALKLARGVLEAKGVVVVFPEGTRSRTGKLGKARPGIGLIAGLGDAQVVPAHIRGSDALAAAVWRRQRVRVSFGRPMIVDRSSAATTDAYRAFATEVMEQIGTLAREDDGR